MRQRTTAVQTAADGTFLAPLAPGPSRRVRIEFAGTPLLGRSQSRTLRLLVRTPVRLHVSSATAVVGGAPVVFAGSVGQSQASIPRSGLPVALQFRLGTGPWAEFRTVQTDPGGHFRYPYAFSDDDSRGVRFQFRARVARQPGWPYGAGVSLPVAVTGR